MATAEVEVKTEDTTGDFPDDKSDHRLQAYEESGGICSQENVAKYEDEERGVYSQEKNIANDIWQKKKWGRPIKRKPTDDLDAVETSDLPEKRPREGPSKKMQNFPHPGKNSWCRNLKKDRKATEIQGASGSGLPAAEIGDRRKRGREGRSTGETPEAKKEKRRSDEIPRSERLVRVMWANNRKAMMTAKEVDEVRKIIAEANDARCSEEIQEGKEAASLLEVERVVFSEKRGILRILAEDKKSAKEVIKVIKLGNPRLEAILYSERPKLEKYRVVAPAITLPKKENGKEIWWRRFVVKLMAVYGLDRIIRCGKREEERVTFFFGIEEGGGDVIRKKERQHPRECPKVFVGAGKFTLFPMGHTLDPEW